MSLIINETTQFKRDIKKLKIQGKNLIELLNIIQLLTEEQPLSSNCFDHDLIGNWQGYRECHIQSDWLLIYKINSTHLTFARSGSQFDLL